MFRVLTFNILSDALRSPVGPWEHRRAAALELLRSCDADVLCLQEASERQCVELEAELDGHQSIRGLKSASTTGLRRLPIVGPAFGAVLGDFTGAHCAIFLRRDRFRLDGVGSCELPFDRGPNPDGADPPHVLSWVRLADRMSDPSVSIYNTHLGHLPWRNTAMARDIRRVLDRDPRDGVQVLCGDMNSLSSWRAIRTLRSANGPGTGELLDSWVIAARRSGPGGTLHLGSGIPVPRIDYIFVRPRVRVVRAEVLVGRSRGRYPSDHCALLVEISAPV